MKIAIKKDKNSIDYIHPKLGIGLVKSDINNVEMNILTSVDGNKRIVMTISKRNPEQEFLISSKKRSNLLTAELIRSEVFDFFFKDIFETRERFLKEKEKMLKRSKYENIDLISYNAKIFKLKTNEKTSSSNVDSFNPISSASIVKTLNTIIIKWTSK